MTRNSTPIQASLPGTMLAQRQVSGRQASTSSTNSWPLPARSRLFRICRASDGEPERLIVNEPCKLPPKPMTHAEAVARRLKSRLLRSKIHPSAPAAAALDVLRGQRPDLIGMHRPMGIMMLPAFTLGAAAALLDAPSLGPAAAGIALGTVFAALDRWAMKRVWAQPSEALRVVVTGGSRGLGKALARELLRQGDAVLLTSRTQAGANAAVRQLKEELGEGAQVWGAACDVADPAHVAALQASAAALLPGGRVDVWVNNAANSGSYKPFLDSQAEDLAEVVTTNLLGTLLGTRAALRAAEGQPGDGPLHVFNMEGAGSDGGASPLYAAYGATKAGIRQLNKSLQAELAGCGRGRLHTLSPGMILTDLLLEGATPATKQAFNILCEQPETVAAFLVPRIRAAVARGSASGAHIAYLTPLSALGRLATFPVRLGRFFDAQGNAVYLSEVERLSGRGAKATARAAATARAQERGLHLAYSLSVALSVLAVVLEAPLLRG